ncbi:phosphoadenosine phosphosulfate reductase family protein [Acutalibacter muris]|uniref:phosphoadenosine phosphosulfate reductase family protein n=1 Tax=Acutalibacter muris TaxID=1796620 RepID=UPI00272E13FB|nr:phosphoadenosine phosphosulfate reductase family protein [Acutalibacter muris]
MDLEHKAIERLKEAAKLSEFYYQKPLLLTYSGGKDSDVCLELCRRAGVPFEVIHSLTTADAPETVYHVRKVFHKLEMEGVKCEILHPRYEGQPTSMWALIPQKRLPPTRTKRWCCQILKEGSSPHRCVVLGVRKHESIGRADAEVAETQGKSKKDRLTFDFDNGDERIIAVCQTKAEIKIHPIVDWTDRDVWHFLTDAKTEVNPCYSMGFQRVGCIGCPIAGKSRWREFQQWPKFENLYRRAFARMLEERKACGKPNMWKTADDVFRWWMEDKNLEGQLDFFGNEIGGKTDGA